MSTSIPIAPRSSAVRRGAVPALVLVGVALLATGCNKNDDDAEPSSAFTFTTQPATAYTQIDRVGMPAVNTALITSKDAYNAATPADDATSLFAGQIVSNLDAIHSKLNDDVTAAGLTPTDTSGSLANAQAAVIPDTLKIDTTVAAGFPNGRKLTDPVIDRTLSLLLLSQSGGQDINTLANLPLNPPANDKAFSATFPYLAAPF